MTMLSTNQRIAAVRTSIVAGALGLPPLMGWVIPKVFNDVSMWKVTLLGYLVVVCLGLLYAIYTVILDDLPSSKNDSEEASEPSENPLLKDPFGDTWDDF